MPNTSPDDQHAEIVALALDGPIGTVRAIAADLAAALLAIAEQAMPDSYFASDTRCQLARNVLDHLDDPRAEEYRR